MDDEEEVLEGSEAVLAPGVDRVAGRPTLVAPVEGAAPPAGGNPEKGVKNCQKLILSTRLLTKIIRHQNRSEDRH